MKTLTIKEFVADQEAILKRVEKGEKIGVTDGEVSAVLVSSDEYYYDLHANGGRTAMYLDLGYSFLYNLKVNLSKQ